MKIDKNLKFIKKTNLKIDFAKKVFYFTTLIMFFLGFVFLLNYTISENIRFPISLNALTFVLLLIAVAAVGVAVMLGAFLVHPLFMIGRTDAEDSLFAHGGDPGNKYWKFFKKYLIVSAAPVVITLLSLLFYFHTNDEMFKKISKLIILAINIAAIGYLLFMDKIKIKSSTFDKIVMYVLFNILFFLWLSQSLALVNVLLLHPYNLKMTFWHLVFITLALVGIHAFILFVSKKLQDKNKLDFPAFFGILSFITLILLFCVGFFSTKELLIQLKISDFDCQKRYKIINPLIINTLPEDIFADATKTTTKCVCVVWDMAPDLYVKLNKTDTQTIALKTNDVRLDQTHLFSADNCDLPKPNDRKIEN